MDKTTAIEILELEIKYKREKADLALDLPKNAPKHKRADRELIASLLRQEADAIEMALEALKAVKAAEDFKIALDAVKETH